MPNRLANETSPYLLQHKDNPVDWYPWGEEALSTARGRDVPLLVSIGYSACHWCHVMAHESFEDLEVAALMNERFVCVKGDREERPDVDAGCMEARPSPPWAPTSTNATGASAGPPSFPSPPCSASCWRAASQKCRFARSRRWRAAGSMTRSEAGSRAMRSTQRGRFPTSRRCSTT